MRAAPSPAVVSDTAVCPAVPELTVTPGVESGDEAVSDTGAAAQLASRKTAARKKQKRTSLLPKTFTPCMESPPDILNRSL
jgi:hypothetical protein